MFYLDCYDDKLSDSTRGHRRLYADNLSVSDITITLDKPYLLFPLILSLKLYQHYLYISVVRITGKYFEFQIIKD
jgi:hypothetical protein